MKTKGEAKFAHAHDWFNQFVARKSKKDLLAICKQLAILCDSDQIQDLFEKEMDADGYFDGGAA